MTFAKHYYTCSIITLCFALPACTSLSAVAERAPRVPFAELPQHSKELMSLEKQPVVVVFEAGDHIPVFFDLNSTVLSTTVRPLPFDLVVSRRFYLLLRPDGMPRISLDGKDFDERHKNHFRFGFSVADRQARVDFGLGILPRPEAARASR